MKTVFDFNITEEEWKHIDGGSKESYLEIVGEESALYDIAMLFHIRGNAAKAKEYAAKLSPVMQEQFFRIISHP